MTTPTPAPTTLEAHWCPDCGRFNQPGMGHPPRNFHWNRGERCRGQWQAIVYRRTDGEG